MGNRTVTVTLQAKIAGLVAGVTTARKSIKEFGDDLDRMAVKQSGKFTKLTNSAAVLGAGLTFAFGSIIKAAYEFDKEMSKVAAVTDSNAQQLDELRKAAISAGAATAYTATEAAQAEEELAKAGVSVTNILNGGLKGALSLAAAGDIDLADAATIAAQAMNQFALGGKAVGHIADILTAGANKSATDVKSLGESLSQVGGVAHQAGLSLDETVGVLSLFAQNGLVGEEAGTAFKTMLLKLENPVDKTKELMKELGLNVYDSAGNFLSAAGLADQLQKSLGGLTNQERNAALGQIFGTRAVRGAIALYEAGAPVVDDWTQKVQDTGLAARTAAKMQDNLAGDVEKLKGSLDTLAIQSSGGATKGLRTLTEAATGTVNVISAMPTPITSTLTVLAGLTGVTSLGAAGFLKAKSSLGSFVDTLREMGPTGIRAANGLTKIGKIAGALTVAGIGAGLLIEGFQALSRWTEKKAHPTAAQIESMAKAIETLGADSTASGELIKQFGADLRGLGQDVDKIAAARKTIAGLQSQLSNMGGGVGPHLLSRVPLAQIAAQKQAIGSDRKAIEELDGALASMVNSGNSNQAAIAFAELTSKANLNYQQINALRAMLPQYNEAVKNSGATTAALAQGFGDEAANAQTLSSSWQELVDKGQKLTDIFQQLNGATINTKEAHISFEQSLDDLAKQLDGFSVKQIRNKKNWDDSTEAGRKNQSMVIDSIKKANEHSEAILEQTGDVGKANTAWLKDIEALRGVLHAAGLTDDQIDTLIRTYGKMPSTVTTQVKAPGLVTANNTASGYFQLLNEIDGKHVSSTVTTHYKTTGGPSPSRWGNVFEHAAQGALRDATYYSAVGVGARYAFAEPSTGGEAFVPKRGNRQRSLGILGKAASWYGASVVPNGWMAARGAQTLELHVVAGDGLASQVLENLRFLIKQKGGDPVKVLTPR